MRQAWLRRTGALCLLLCTLLGPAALHAGELPQLDLAVELDPVTRRFSAVAQFESTQRELRVTLHRSLAVRDATVGGKSVSVRGPITSRQHSIWILPLPRSGKVVLTYAGTLPALDPGIDHREVLRSASPMASARGSFLPAGSHWHPSPGEFFTYRVRLTLPGPQRGLVPGDLVSETLPSPAAPRYQAVFEFRQPADGIDLMVAPYSVDERLVNRPGSQPLRLRTYFTAPLRDLAPAYLDDSARYIDMYARAIGPYPYASFSVVASPLPTGFGMPTLTYIGEEVLKLPFIRATSLGHEVLHNWWGNGVFPDYASGNWSEGLTTFMADYAYKERESAAAARDMRVGWIRDMAAVPMEARMPLTQFRSRTHGAEAATGYGKAAMVFFMLRDLIGEDAYGRGIRLFWERHQFKTASWQHLRQAFEDVSGRSLQRFFTQWLTRSDAPRITVSEATATSSNGRYRIALKIQQTPSYALRVPVSVVSGSHTETHIVAIDRADNEVRLETHARPEAVKLDPDLALWRQMQPEELPPILRQWIVARAPQYFVASQDARMQEAAISLARRFFETPPPRAANAPVEAVRQPLLIIGLQADIDALLLRLGLPPRPAELAANATAYVWTVPGIRPGMPPVAVISARDAKAIEALQRPLPHYGSQSYLAFEDSRLVKRGVWPVASRAVPVSVR